MNGSRGRVSSTGAICSVPPPEPLAIRPPTSRTPSGSVRSAGAGTLGGIGEEETAVWLWIPVGYYQRLGDSGMFVVLFTVVLLAVIVVSCFRVRCVALDSW